MKKQNLRLNKPCLKLRNNFDQHFFKIMIKTNFLFLILSFFILSCSGKKTDKLVLHFFGSEKCQQCVELKDTILIPFNQVYEKKLEIKFYNTNENEYRLLYKKYLKAYELPDVFPQVLFFPDFYLIGYNDIKTYTQEYIEKYLEQPKKWIYKDIDKQPFDENNKTK